MKNVRVNTGQPSCSDVPKRTLLSLYSHIQHEHTNKLQATELPCPRDAKGSGSRNDDSEPAKAGGGSGVEETHSPPARGTSCRDRRINLRKEAERAVTEAESATAEMNKALSQNSLEGY